MAADFEAGVGEDAEVAVLCFAKASGRWLGPPSGDRVRRSTTARLGCQLSTSVARGPPQREKGD
jgi:hypothetical protein